MTQYEYKVIPTPRRPRRAKGVKGVPARFANVLTEAINAQAADGWEFIKTETLPMESKPGLFRASVESFQSVIVFRRAIAAETPADEDFDSLSVSGTLVAVSAGKPEPKQLVDSSNDLPVFERSDPPMSAFGASDGEGAIDASTAQGDEEHTAQSDEDESGAADTTDSDDSKQPNDDLAFDKDDRDPLKRLVEANRGARGSK